MDRLEEVTRVVVVDHRKEGRGGVVIEAWDCQATLDVQDNGRTLKIFIDDPQ